MEKKNECIHTHTYVQEKIERKKERKKNRYMTLLYPSVAKLTLQLLTSSSQHARKGGIDFWNGIELNAHVPLSNLPPSPQIVSRLSFQKGAVVRKMSSPISSVTVT